MENPCYNRKTKESCPDRKAKCAVACKKWQEYTEKRDKEYQENLQKRAEERTFIELKNRLKVIEEHSRRR